VEDEVGPVLERPHVDRRGSGCIDEHGRRRCRGGVEVGEREEGVRRSLDPYEVGSRRRLASLVEVDPAQSPAAEIVYEHPDAVIRVAGERDLLPMAEEAE
jgi:hypothetical protein